jgi:hypothetical protein
MDGFPLILLGVTLFAIAYAMLKIQSRMKEVTKAIDSGFRTIEDGVTQNLLGPQGAITKATTALDQGYLTLKTGIDTSVLGPTGLLSKSRYIMDYANTICVGLSNDITSGRLILKNDIRKTTADIETILQNAGDPLINAGDWLNDIGDGIDIDIAGAHPFHDLAQPFRDVGNTVDGVGDLCLDAKTKLVTADQKIILAENALDEMSLKVKSLGGEIIEVRNYVDNAFATNINSSMNNLKHVTDNVKVVFSSLEVGAQASVTNLKNANTYLDSLLNNMFQKKYIMGLSAAGIALILAGIAIGI